MREEERGGKREAALSPSRTALNTSRHSHALPARRARFLACCLEGIAASGLEGGRETERRPLPCTAWPHKRLGHPSARRGRPASQTDNGLLSF